MSWSLDIEEEIEEFAKWLVGQFCVPGNEPPEASIVMAIDRYFEGDLGDD